MEKFKEKYRIESTRLPGWNYANPGYYFITICVKNRECVLGRVENDEMVLSPAGKIVQSEWLKTPEIRKNVQLDAFQIMPNHLHGIIIITHNMDNPGNNKSDNNGMDGAIMDGANGIDGEIIDGAGRDGVNGRDGENGGDDVNGIDGKNVETRCTVSLQSQLQLKSQSQLKLQPQSQSQLQLQPQSPLLPPEQYIRQGFSLPDRQAGRTYKNTFGPQRQNLASIIGGIKSAATVNVRKINPDFQWQRLYDDHVVRNSGELNRIRQYIKNNPANWGSDDKNPKIINT